MTTCQKELLLACGAHVNTVLDAHLCKCSMRYTCSLGMQNIGVVDLHKLE